MLHLVLLLLFSVHICGETYLNATDNSESQKVFSSNTTESRETISEKASTSHFLFPSTSYFYRNSSDKTQLISLNSHQSVANPLITPSVNPVNRITSMFTHATAPSNITPFKITTQKLTSSERRKRESISQTINLETTTESTVQGSNTEPPTPEITSDALTSNDTTTDTDTTLEKTTTDTTPEKTTTDTTPEKTTTDTTPEKTTTVTTPEKTTTDTTPEKTTTDTTPEFMNTTTSNVTDTTTSTTTDITTSTTTDTTTSTTTDTTPSTTTDTTPSTTTDTTTSTSTDTTTSTTTDTTTSTTTDTTTSTTTDTTTSTTTDTTTSITTDTTTSTTTDTTTSDFTETTPVIIDPTTSNATTTDTTLESTSYYSTTDTSETTSDTTFPNCTTDSPTTIYTSDVPSTNTSETTEITTSQSTYIPTTTDGANITDDANTTSSFTSTQPSAEKDKSTAVLLGILIPVLVIGVSVILWMGYRSGRLVWPPKYLSSDSPDNVRPSYIALKKFPAHCDHMLEDSSKINSEFELLKTLSDDIIYRESFVAAQMPDNKVKNRYTNILPYDSTRVKLIPEGNDFFSDYINASYIKGYTNEIEYIATQGPKEETSRDFWRMIYQEPVKVIVMVTQFEEMGKPKCHKYFPNLRENIVLDDISIWCTTELHFPIYTSRTLVLAKDDRKRSITHLHFREWPDFGCPSTPDLMLQFCQVMRQHIIVAQPGITVVHCSAGVGRTGTLIAVDILLQQINENKKISVFDTVYKLRKHRVNMVQSEAQYVYIYKCLKEALENPSYLASENSSSSSMEPIYENIECTRMSPSSKIPAEIVTIESEFVF